MELFMQRVVRAVRRLFSRPGRAAKSAAAREIEARIVDALAIYLGGNPDRGRLRTLAAAYPAQVRETIMRCQAMVGGRREELCDLAIALGYVEEWWRDAQSRSLAKRRRAFSSIAAMAHSEPVRRMAAEIAPRGLEDQDPQVRAGAARILLAGGNPGEMTRVFCEALCDPEGLGAAIGVELGRHADALCRTAVPGALGSSQSLRVLRLLVSWRRALALPDVLWLAKNRDQAVRRETMLLLPYLPATPENRAALRAGLGDEEPAVREAAAAAPGAAGEPDSSELEGVACSG
jgi:hypothetical protein